MKKAIVLAALTLMSASAFASKARQAALGSTGNTVMAVTTADDVQEVFVNPAKMFNFGDMLTVEYGAINEGGFFRSNGDTKWGLYLGNRSETFATLVSGGNTAAIAAGAAAPGPFLAEQNPFEVFYGAKGADMAWGVSFKYSQGEDKETTQKVNTMGIRGGVSTDVYEAYVTLGLAGKSENGKTALGAPAVQSDLGLRVGGEYFLGDSTVYGDVISSSGKATATGAADVKTANTTIQLGYESKIKGEGSHFFYGVKLVNSETKVGDAKDQSMKLPLYAGVEADAASWLALRGFVSQSVLLNTAKNTNAAGTTTLEKSGANDSAAGLGASLKFGKLSLDGTLSATTAGVLNTDTLLAQTSLNFMF